MDDCDMLEADAVGDRDYRDAYDMKVELTQHTDHETGFRFHMTYHPAAIPEGELGDRPIEVCRGEDATFRLVDWNRVGGPDIMSVLDGDGYGWLAELLEPVGADKPEHSACLCEGVGGKWHASEIVDVSALRWIEVDDGYRGCGVGRLAAMRLVEMLPHGHDGLLAIPVRVPSLEELREAGARGEAWSSLLLSDDGFEPNNRLADYFETGGAFERIGDIMVSRREAILRTICRD